MRTIETLMVLCCKETSQNLHVSRFLVNENYAQSITEEKQVLWNALFFFQQLIDAWFGVMLSVSSADEMLP